MSTVAVENLQIVEDKCRVDLKSGKAEIVVDCDLQMAEQAIDKLRSAQAAEMVVAWAKSQGLNNATLSAPPGFPFGVDAEGKTGVATPVAWRGLFKVTSRF